MSLVQKHKANAIERDGDLRALSLVNGYGQVGGGAGAVEAVENSGPGAKAKTQ